MRFRAISTSVFVLLTTTVACGSFSDEPAAPTPPPADPGGPTPGETPAPEPPPAPPLVGTPSDDEINETFGVFVMLSAPAGGEGTRLKPFNALGAALKAGKASSRRVYVCEGTFKESITVERGISMVGGLDCTTWKPTGKRTVVESPTSPAITATGIDAPTRIEGFEIKAPKGTDASPSSIGLHAKNAPAVTFASCKIFADKGDDGASATEPTALVLGPNANGKAGVPARPVGGDNPTQISLGADGGLVACIGATVPSVPANRGGGGGYGGSFYCPGGGLPYNYYEPSEGEVYRPSGGYWGWPSDLMGKPGAPGKDGTSAAAGTLSADGFKVGSGVAGTNGGVGYGGQGGPAVELYGQACTTWTFGASGEGGGAGGCPGLAGSPGTGGGASIGVLVASSAGITFEATEITASDGGAGGAGALGAAPTAGGAKGQAQGPVPSGMAPGFPGGPGGRAGASGSGAGGPSIAFAYTGGFPTIAGTVKLAFGKGGAGVPEKKVTAPAAEARTRPASGAGIAKDLLAF